VTEQAPAPLPLLLESDVDPNPFVQFDRWYAHACSQPNLAHPDAVTLATTSRDGIPDARTMLLKGRDPVGFTFYTNYESHKGHELAENPRACLLFFWPAPAPAEGLSPASRAAAPDRQIRILGAVARVTREESEAYFKTRIRGSQIGAWASKQDCVLSTREELDARVAEMTTLYEGEDVPCPTHWGGYRLTPTSLEFWQARASRLHDRLRYTRRADGTWRVERLSP
jgi:pyridoxamine 5'-phosphate oxidase